MSVAQANRRQLEAIGDYVTRANVDWFAVFPEKLAELEQAAADNARQANLIVYRTRSADERDHHVIPLEDLAGLFTSDTLTHSEVNGTVRWNVTLKAHVLRVSHSDLSVDVSRHFRASLAIEVSARTGGPSRPVDLEPPERVLSTAYRILRDTTTARQLKVDHDHSCQICGTSIELPDGTRYSEAHHIRPLGRPHCGLDARENMLVLCPNHHAMCDYGVIPLTMAALRFLKGHAIGQEFIDYHNERVARPR